MKQVTSSWSIFIQHQRIIHLFCMMHSIFPNSCPALGVDHLSESDPGVGDTTLCRTDAFVHKMKYCQKAQIHSLKLLHF